VYVILSDSQDMLESLKVVLIVMKKRLQLQVVKQPSALTEPSFDRDEEANDIYYQPTSHNEENKVPSNAFQMNFISLMPTRSRNEGESASSKDIENISD
jgi:hypothetical protein